MKTRIYLLCSLLVTGMMSSCSDTWDEHYKNTEEVVENATISSVNMPITNYLEQENTLKSTYEMFQSTGILEKLTTTDQLHTILAVENGSLKSTKEMSAEDLFIAQTYVSNVALSPSNITDGQQILMWSGKYLQISKSEDGEGISFNNAKVTKVIKLNNGYLYILNEAVSAPRNLYETIQNLGEDYSIFKEMVMARNARIFDRTNSPEIDVDPTGNTVYDSIFVDKFSYFEEKDFDIMSENLTATLLLPSNAIINEAINTAKSNLQTWGMERKDSVLQNWILQSCFYNQTYTKEDFENNTDLKSVFNTVWRTSIQKVDLDNPITMSNGVAYRITKMKIPTNVLIYRLKELFRNYEYMTQGEKDTYFKAENLSFKEIKKSGNMTGLGWTQAGVDEDGNYLFPEIKNYYTLRFNLTDDKTKSYNLKITPFKFKGNATAHTTNTYLIPPGEYDLCLGLEQDKKGGLGEITVYFNGKKMSTISASTLKKTDFHYDRGAGGYPEGFDKNKAKAAGWKKSGNYDRDGKKVGTVVIEGDEPQKVELEFVGSGSGLLRCWLYHWCLKPTSNCY